MSYCWISRERYGPITITLAPASGYKVPQSTRIEPWNQWICLHIFTQTTCRNLLLCRDGTESILYTSPIKNPSMKLIYPFISLNEEDQAYTNMLLAYLSSLKFSPSLIAMIFEDVKTLVNNISLENIEDKDYQLYNMIVKIPFYCEDIIRDTCLVNEVVSESIETSDIEMVPANMQLTENLLKKIEVKGKGDFSAVDDKEKAKNLYVNEGDKCSICLEEFCIKQCVLMMPCSHVFHENCIKDWLKKSHYCPLCRFQMPANHVDEEDEVNSI